MNSTVITEELLALAAQHGACDEGLERARACIRHDACTVLDREDLAWVVKHLPLPDPIAEELERRGYGRSWRSKGVLHREDGPAFVRSDGKREWWRNGKRHRDDGPAVELPDGTVEWWHHGRRHRDDGPAIERSDGRVEWWHHGERID